MEKEKEEGSLMGSLEGRETLNRRTENLGAREKKRTQEDTKEGNLGLQGSRTRFTTHPLCDS